MACINSAPHSQHPCLHGLHQLTATLTAPMPKWLASTHRHTHRPMPKWLASTHHHTHRPMPKWLALTHRHNHSTQALMACTKSVDLQARLQQRLGTGRMVAQVRHSQFPVP
eukprot:scaffold227980_cov20-Tisochrysis_lutea.AAC.1